MNKLRGIVLALLALSLLLPCGCGGKAPAPGTGPAAEPPASEAPPSEEEDEPIYITFQGTDLEGNPVSQDVFKKSRLTMVNVWATYCNPCLSEMPGLGELAAEYDGSEFQVIGIVSDVKEGEDQTLVESLVQQTGADYPHLLANDSIGQALLAGVTGVPTTFFFGEDGAYLGGVVGAAEKSTWEEIIREFLEKT